MQYKIFSLCSWSWFHRFRHLRFQKSPRTIVLIWFFHFCNKARTCFIIWNLLCIWLKKINRLIQAGSTSKTYQNEKPFSSFNKRSWNQLFNVTFFKKSISLHCVYSLLLPFAPSLHVFLVDKFHMPGMFVRFIDQSGIGVLIFTSSSWSNSSESISLAEKLNACHD